MSLYTGKKCVCCGETFTDNDDVVVCPQCGAPHHRNCYNKTNKCSQEYFHGTENEWSKKNRLNYDEASPVKSDSKQKKSTGDKEEVIDLDKFAVYGFMDENSSIDDISAKEWAAFVGKGSYFYLTKFTGMDKTGKNTWNGGAFIFGFLYFFYRKLFKQGIILLLVMAIASIPNLALISHYAEFIVDESKTHIVTVNSAEEITEKMMNPETNPKYESLMFWFGLANIMVTVKFIIAVIVGFSANRIYMNHCIKKIKYTRAALMDYTTNRNYFLSLHMLGGANIKTAMGVAAIFWLLKFAVSFIIVSGFIVR